MKKSTKIASCLAALAIVTTVGGAFAYFSDTKTVSNTFTLGNGVEIQLNETEWDKLESSDKILIPNKLYAKDPVIINDSKIPVHAFIQVDIPVAKVAVDNETEPSNHELFQLINEEGNSGINRNWIVQTEKIYVDNNGDKTSGLSDTTTTKSRTVYCYDPDLLASDGADDGDDETNSLFSNVKFVNIKDTTGLSETYNINITGMAIQKDTDEMTRDEAYAALIASN